MDDDFQGDRKKIIYKSLKKNSIITKLGIII